jgi:hypothetical protein
MLVAGQTHSPQWHRQNTMHQRPHTHTKTIHDHTNPTHTRITNLQPKRKRNIPQHKITNKGFSTRTTYPLRFLNPPIDADMCHTTHQTPHQPHQPKQLRTTKASTSTNRAPPGQPASIKDERRTRRDILLSNTSHIPTNQLKHRGIPQSQK